MAATVKQALCGLSPQYNLFNLRVRNDAAVEVGRDDATVEEKKQKIMSAISERGWFTDQV